MPYRAHEVITGERFDKEFTCPGKHGAPQIVLLAFTDIMMMPMPVISVLISSAALMPSISGMLISMSTTSGCSLRAV